MINLRTPDWRRLTAPGGVALAFAGLAVLTLATGSRSASGDERLRAVEARAEQLEVRLAALRAAPRTPHQLCTLRGAAAETALEGRLTQAAEAAGFAWSETRFERAEADQAELIVFSAVGRAPYASVVGALDRLSRTGPTVFVDSLRLRQAAGGVQVELEGRVLCSTASA